jgi:hypothetical protein
MAEMSLIRVNILPEINAEQLISCLDSFEVREILTRTTNIYYYCVSRTIDYINFETIRKRITNT